MLTTWKCTEKGKPCLFLKIQVNIYAVEEVMSDVVLARHDAEKQSSATSFVISELIIQQALKTDEMHT